MWCLACAACGRIRIDELDDANRPTTPSCSGLAATCGAMGTSTCCASPLVPGGTFYRSFDVGTDNANTDVTNLATVSDFRLDTYVVTVGRFRQFVNADMGTQQNPPPAGAGARTLNGSASQGGWDPSWNGFLTTDTASLVAIVKCDATYESWTDTPDANEALPMNCITWFEAFAFCVWDGGFLPTETEWNYAAAGGSEQRAYPWSNPPSDLTIDCSYANFNTGSAYCANPPSGSVNAVGSESPAGDGRWGQADLAGNAYGWALDWYQSPYANPCNDCADLTPTSDRVIRGGGFPSPASNLRGAHRDYASPNARGSDIGVRCARTP